MIENEVPVQIYRRDLRISVEGLTPIEISTIAGQVSEKMKEIEEETGTVDTAKLAILAAVTFAADLYTLRQQSSSLRQADEKRITEMISSLNSVLGKELL